MAWCPFAVHRPLSENHTQGGITPRAVILHTAWSGASSLYGFFQNNSNLESHFYVANDGTIEQYMDTGIRADANKNANGFAVSIETQDDRAIKSWNSAQLDALVRLVKWICDTHDIPKRRIESAYGSGIGWHVQFGAPGPWTPSAKTCPGGPRIEQVKNYIIPRVAVGGGGAAPGQEQEPNMSGFTPTPLPDTNGAWEYRTFPVESGSKSSVVKDIWFVLASGWGSSTDYQVIACTGPGKYAPLKGFPTSGTLVDGDRVHWKIPDSVEVLALKYKSNGNAQASYAFPHTAK